MISKATRALSLLNKTEKKAYTIITLSLFAISLLSIFVLAPSIKVVAGFQKKLVEAKKVDNQLSVKIENLVKLQQQLENHEAETKKLNTAIPNSLLQDIILKRAAFISAKSNSAITKIKFEGDKGTKEESSLIETSLSFNVSGSQDNIFAFLKSLEKEDRLIKIRQVVVRRDEAADTASIESSVFYTK